MKVVLLSLMLLLAFIAIDCRPFEETEKRDEPDEIDEEIYREYLNWKVEQPQDSDKSFQRFLELTSTKIEEERELSDNNLEERGGERARRKCWKICYRHLCYTRCS